MLCPECKKVAKGRGVTQDSSTWFPQTSVMSHAGHGYLTLHSIVAQDLVVTVSRGMIDADPFFFVSQLGHHRLLPDAPHDQWFTALSLSLSLCERDYESPSRGHGDVGWTAWSLPLSCSRKTQLNHTQKRFIASFAEAGKGCALSSGDQEGLFVSSPGELVLCGLNPSHAPLVHVASPLHAAIGVFDASLPTPRIETLRVRPPDFTLLQAYCSCRHHARLRHTSIPKIGLSFEKRARCPTNMLCFVRRYIVATTMQVFREVVEGARRDSTETSHLDQQPRVPGSDGILLLFCQRPAPTQPRGAREDAHLEGHHSLTERDQRVAPEKFPIAEHRRSFLCAVSYRTPAVSSWFDHRADEFQRAFPPGILPKYMCHFSLQINGAARVL